MINWRDFINVFIIGSIPIIMIVILEIKDKILYKEKNFVRVSIILKVVCVFACFISLFGAVTNGLDYYYCSDGDLWFVILMTMCYLSLIVVLCVMYNEKIIYSQECNQIIFFRRFHKEFVSIHDITRIYSGKEYLDIYLGEKRIRYGNNFLSGADEFEHFVKGILWNKKGGRI